MKCFSGNHFTIFWVVANFVKTLVVRRLVEELGHSIYGDNNLVPFQLLWKEAMPKPEKSLYDLPKIAPFLQNTSGQTILHIQVWFPEMS